MKLKVYKSCNCERCNADSDRKGRKKRLAHRRFRQINKRNLKKGDDNLVMISTGYTD